MQSAQGARSIGAPHVGVRSSAYTISRTSAGKSRKRRRERRGGRFGKLSISSSVSGVNESLISSNGIAGLVKGLPRSLTEPPDMWLWPEILLLDSVLRPVSASSNIDSRIVGVQELVGSMSVPKLLRGPLLGFTLKLVHVIFDIASSVVGVHE